MALENNQKLKKPTFEEISTPYLESLYRSAWSMTHSDADSQDLVQETLLKAYKAYKNFDGRYPKAWLLTILRNTFINNVRKKQAQLLDNPDDPFNEINLSSNLETPEDIVIDPLFEERLEDSYNNLSPDYRQVVDLVDLDGLSYKEAAQKLDVPVGTVMSRLHRARNNIKNQLERSEEA